jgi:hypothetical protein
MTVFSVTGGQPDSLHFGLAKSMGTMPYSAQRVHDSYQFVQGAKSWSSHDWAS